MAAACFMATADSSDKPLNKPQQSRTPDKPPLTLEEARGRAKLLHATYESTLIAVHRAYFTEGNRQPVPARVLEGVFYWMDQENKTNTHWISVNTEAMNLDHQPESDIEKKAAKVLASGEEQFELIEDGVYHHAGAITLVASCLRCHEPNLFQKQKRKRVAGLVISIPIKKK